MKRVINKVNNIIWKIKEKPPINAFITGQV
jgi:hypothetical protein